MLGYIVLLFSLPNYARSIGLSAKQGSVIGALLNLGQGKISELSGSTEVLTQDPGIGRPLVGYFSDAAGRINMAGTCTFLAGLFCLVIVSAISKPLLSIPSRSNCENTKAILVVVLKRFYQNRGETYIKQHLLTLLSGYLPKATAS